MAFIDVLPVETFLRLCEVGQEGVCQEYNEADWVYKHLKERLVTGGRVYRLLANRDELERDLLVLAVYRQALVSFTETLEDSVCLVRFVRLHQLCVHRPRQITPVRIRLVLEDPRTARRSKWLKDFVRAYQRFLQAIDGL